MEKAILGDNQFFAVNHLSDERSRAQAERFRDDGSILAVLGAAMDCGIRTFMCTTHDRMAGIVALMRGDAARYGGFKFYPCMPYAHKYANAVTELGILGTLKAYVPGNVLSAASRAGAAYVRRDFPALMELMVDAEMKMFEGVETPVIFLQNVVVDLLMGLGMDEMFVRYAEHVRGKYGAEPGFITMNMPRFVDLCGRLGIREPVVCSSVNKLGFRMGGGKEEYERYLRRGNGVRLMAMQCLAAGALRPREAMEYVCGFPNIESVVFGASSRAHIEENMRLIEELSARRA